MAYIFRIHHKKTNKFRDIQAADAAHAVEIAGWKPADVEVKVKTSNGSGGWAKVKAVSNPCGTTWVKGEQR